MCAFVSIASGWWCTKTLESFKEWVMKWEKSTLSFVPELLGMPMLYRNITFKLFSILCGYLFYILLNYPMLIKYSKMKNKSCTDFHFLRRIMPAWRKSLSLMNHLRTLALALWYSCLFMHLAILISYLMVFHLSVKNIAKWTLLP